MIKINKKEKDKLRDDLYKRDGRECYYCGIKEDDFIPIWGKFYGGKTRGRKLVKIFFRQNKFPETFEKN
ncbi:hypothetical protein ES705_33898 [subsurface metagenome]